MIKISLIFSISLGMAFGLMNASAEDSNTERFEFRSLLHGLTSDTTAQQNRDLKNTIRKTLKDRELEIWEFVKASYYDRDDKLHYSDLHVGLSALFLIGGFDDQILDEYFQMLEAEASDFESFDRMFQQRRAREITISDEESGILAKRVKFVGVGLGVFGLHEIKLPREIVAKYLTINDSLIQARVIDWYVKYGELSDISYLIEKADELRKSGAPNSADTFLDAVKAIESRSKILPSESVQQ